MQDLSGRPHLSFDLQIPTQRVGTYDTQVISDLFTLDICGSIPSYLSSSVQHGYIFSSGLLSL